MFEVNFIHSAMACYISISVITFRMIIAQWDYLRFPELIQDMVMVQFLSLFQLWWFNISLSSLNLDLFVMIICYLFRTKASRPPQLVRQAWRALQRYNAVSRRITRADTLCYQLVFFSVGREHGCWSRSKVSKSHGRVECMSQRRLTRGVFESHVGAGRFQVGWMW